MGCTEGAQLFLWDRRFFYYLWHVKKITRKLLIIYAPLWDAPKVLNFGD